MNRETWKQNLLATLALETPKSVDEASIPSKGRALANAILLAFHGARIKSNKEHRKEKIACYMSLEFLMGKSILNHLQCLGKETMEMVIEVVEEVYDVDFQKLIDWEPDAGLGNGGLGRLAACLMDSSATTGVPLRGYGLRYEKGIFSQRFVNGFQEEIGDTWLQERDPWGIRCDEEIVEIELGDIKAKAVPYDYIVPGYGVKNVNRLRLWKAEAMDDFNFSKFNAFDYDGALSERNRIEDITRVLYPNDEKREGVLLRFTQQYFFAQATIKDLYRLFKSMGKNLSHWGDYLSIQLNDTHPVIAIGEMLRILMEEENMDFKKAVTIVEGVFSYTNHTLLKEALETWEISIVETICPKTYELIKQMDEYYQERMHEKGLGNETIKKLRIVESGRVHMAHLGIHASKKVNGVAELHSSILKEIELKEFSNLYPDKFTNVTNGVTPRRFLFMANPKLSDAIDEWLGSDRWREDIRDLKQLESLSEDETVLNKFMSIKTENKKNLAKLIWEKQGIRLDPESIFDIQIKRIHEYKRQLLNAFHIYHLYKKIKDNPKGDFTPRTFIFGGKAAPGYHRAKGIIKYINELARVINQDPDIKNRIKVVYIEDYDVSWAEKLISAADVSEQISTAGKEASGTGNMKFMMNGTVTLGTMDGANVEIFREAGLENNYVFGATVEELRALNYSPQDLYETNIYAKEAVDSLMSGEFDDNNTFKFLDLYNALLRNDFGGDDEYYILHDLESYIRVQEKIGEDFKDKKEWAKKCFINLANSGKFTSDRTILEYAENIWQVKPNKLI